MQEFVTLDQLSAFKDTLIDYYSKTLFEFEVAGPPNNLEEVALDLAKRFKSQSLRQQLREETIKLKLAEQNHDQVLVDKLLESCQNITQAINKLNS